MAIRAVVFDSGGVLETTPDPQMQAMSARWDARLKRAPGDLDATMAHLWQAGSLGQCTEADVSRRVCATMREPVALLRHSTAPASS